MAFYVSKTRRSVSKAALLALLVLAGCSSADFTNVHHVATGGAAGSGAARYGGAATGATSTAGTAGATSTMSAAGAATAAGGRTGAGGSEPLPANAGSGNVSSSGSAGGVARGGSASQAGSGGSTSRAGSGFDATAGYPTTDAGSAGMPAGTGGRSAAGGAAGTSGTSGTSGGEPIGGCNHQLLANADFEAGAGLPWQESSDWPGVTIVVPASDAGLQKEGVSPYGGNYLAWLGGIPDNPYDHYEVTLTQELTIPEATSELTLSGEYLIHSEDGAEGAYDEAYLQLNIDDETEWLARSFTNQDMGREWKSFTARTTDLDPLRGKTVTFIAYSRTDLDGKTSFWLDDLRLQATCGR
jgi:hypothetical protein